jgi:pyruvate,water dikinase
MGRPTKEILKERDRINRRVTRKTIRTDQDREAFDQALEIARISLPYAEDHCFYVRHWFHSLFWAR